MTDAEFASDTRECAFGIQVARRNCEGNRLARKSSVKRVGVVISTAASPRGAVGGLVHGHQARGVGRDEAQMRHVPITQNSGCSARTCLTLPDPVGMLAMRMVVPDLSSSGNQFAALDSDFLEITALQGFVGAGGIDVLIREIRHGSAASHALDSRRSTASRAPPLPSVAPHSADSSRLVRS